MFENIDASMGCPRSLRPGARRPLLIITVLAMACGATAITAAAEPAKKPPPSSLVITPASLKFGKIELGAKSPAQSVTITNKGSAPVTFSASAEGFDFINVTTGCYSETGTTLAPGASCILTVRFEPSYSGLRTSAIKVFSERRLIASVPIKGIGLQLTP